MQRRNFLRKVGGVPYSFGDAIELNGSNQYLVLPFVFNTNIFTFSLWFNLDVIANMGLLGKLGSNVSYMSITTNTIRYRAGGAAQDFLLPAFSTGQWYHLLLAQDGTVGRCFLNGVESSTGSVINGGSINLDIVGAINTFNRFDGKLDDVLITNTYNNPSSEAVAIYNGGAGADPLSVIPTAQQLLRFNNNYNNDGTLGGSATPFNSPTFVPHV